MGSLGNSDVEQVVRPDLCGLPFQDGQLIVKFKDDADIKELKALNPNYPVALAKRFHTGAGLIKMPEISRNELIKLKENLDKSGCSSSGISQQ